MSGEASLSSGLNSQFVVLLSSLFLRGGFNGHNNQQKFGNVGGNHSAVTEDAFGKMRCPFLMPGATLWEGTGGLLHSCGRQQGTVCPSSVWRSGPVGQKLLNGDPVGQDLLASVLHQFPLTQLHNTEVPPVLSAGFVFAWLFLCLCNAFLCFCSLARSTCCFL